MKLYKVESTKRALADADEAFMWIFNEGVPEAALLWYDGLIEALRSLERSPLRCGSARENSFFEDDIRQLIYGRYRILFTVKGNTVYVLRVRHAARKTLNPGDELAEARRE